MEYVAKAITSIVLIGMLYALSSFEFKSEDYYCLVLIGLIGGLLIIWNNGYKVLDRILRFFE